MGTRHWSNTGKARGASITDASLTSFGTDLREEIMIRKETGTEDQTLTPVTAHMEVLAR
jgi:hypothetical protein